MTTMTKMDMIKKLVEENKVEEFKKEKDDDTKLASRLFRTLTNENVKELYAARISASPEKAIEEITKKVEKAAKKAPAKEEVKAEVKEKDPMYSPAKDAAGNEYKKAWVLQELDERGFSPLSGLALNIRKFEGKTNTLIYHRNKNILNVKSNETDEIIQSTMCLCPFIVKAFITKYAK